MNAHTPTTDQRETNTTKLLRLTWQGAAGGAFFAIALPLLMLVILSVLTTLVLPDSGPFALRFDVNRELDNLFTSQLLWLVPTGAVVGVALTHGVTALENFLDRRRAAEHLRITTCEACNGPKIMHGNPAIWVCADPTCIMRERAWWER